MARSKNRKCVRYSKSVVERSELEILREYIERKLNAPWNEIVKEPLLKYCYNGICFIVSSSENVRKADLMKEFNVVFGGEVIGIVYRGYVFPSLNVYERVFHETGEFRAAIIANEEGVKNFLYGNNLYASSIIEYYEPIDNIVAIIDNVDMKAIGVAKPIVHGRRLREYIQRKLERPVYENIFDLGLFLRGFY